MKKKIKFEFLPMVLLSIMFPINNTHIYNYGDSVIILCLSWFIGGIMFIMSILFMIGDLKFFKEKDAHE